MEMQRMHIYIPMGYRAPLCGSCRIGGDFRADVYDLGVYSSGRLLIIDFRVVRVDPGR